VFYHFPGSNHCSLVMTEAFLSLTSSLVNGTMQEESHRKDRTKPKSFPCGKVKREHQRLAISSTVHPF
jgi:hypothetical protein